jgi:GDP-4-dehydro-6-deoxy-D-mannose reductase
MKKKILVTGSTGFVGSHMVDFLLKNIKNIDIYCTKRYHLSKLDNVKQFYNKVFWLDCDITDPISVTKIIKEVKPDKIFHFAAESFVSPSWNHPNRYMSVNYNGTLNILESIRNFSKNSKIIIPGSGEEYGEVQYKDLPINEKTILKPVNPYAVSKIAQDLIAFVYFKSYGTKVIRTRTFNHEGPRRENVFGISSYAYQIARIERGLQEPIIKVGILTDKRNFTHVYDIVKAYWKASEKCLLGELYLIGNERRDSIFTFKQTIEMLIKLSDFKNIKYKKYKPFVRPTNVPYLIADISKFKKKSGWKPLLSINDILSDTLNYWRDKLDNGGI